MISASELMHYFQSEQLNERLRRVIFKGVNTVHRTKDNNMEHFIAAKKHWAKYLPLAFAALLFTRA